MTDVPAWLSHNFPVNCRNGDKICPFDCLNPSGVMRPPSPIANQSEPYFRQIMELRAFTDRSTAYAMSGVISILLMSRSWRSRIDESDLFREQAKSSMNQRPLGNESRR